MAAVRGPLCRGHQHCKEMRGDAVARGSMLSFYAASLAPPIFGEAPGERNRIRY